jgi:hypothetical protein
MAISVSRTEIRAASAVFDQGVAPRLRRRRHNRNGSHTRIFLLIGVHSRPQGA